MKNDKTLKRALITGATGYIGSNLVRHLIKDGWDVHVVVREHSDLTIIGSEQQYISIHRHNGSTRGMVELMNKAKPSVVFHLASLFLAQHRTEDVEALITSNLMFSTQLVQAMAETGTENLVNTGTSWQYYHSVKYCPVNLYAATKKAFEEILAYYSHANGVKAITLLLFDTYGPDDPRQKLVPMLEKAIINKQALEMSPGDQLMDLVYIEDIVRAYVVAANLVENQTEKHMQYGLSSRRRVSLKKLINIFDMFTQTKVDVSFNKRPYRSREVMFPWDDFQQLPGWSAEVSLEEGIKRLHFNKDSPEK